MSDMYKQMEELYKKIDKMDDKIISLTNINKLQAQEHKKEVHAFKQELAKKDKIIMEQDNKIEKLEREVLRLKNQINKDSSNSSKPSSTNGYKKVITNRREKSDKNKGGQIGHKGVSLGKKQVEKIMANENVIKKATVEVNKTDKNKDKAPYKTTLIDIDVSVSVTEYLYYPNEHGNYDIPQWHKKHFVYGNNVKALAAELMFESYNSTDATQTIISSLTDNCIQPSKSTLINWSQEVAQKLQPEVETIEERLLNTYYAHFDESQIKVDGEAYNEVCVSDKNYTRMYVMKSKAHEELAKIDLFNSYTGIIVKDGTNLYNGFGGGFSQCISHILRHLKGVYDFCDHKEIRRMSRFLKENNKYRDKLIEEGIESFSQEEYDSLMVEYEEILRACKKEWMADTKSSVYDEERKILTRLENEKYQILYFLKDFKIPATNNPVELDQRNIKIKQKIGKFRSEAGAQLYAIIRSCINTYKKQKVNVYRAFIRAFEGDTILV